MVFVILLDCQIGWRVVAVTPESARFLGLQSFSTEDQAYRQLAGA
jgi:hypothetical protein